MQDPDKDAVLAHRVIGFRLDSAAVFERHRAAEPMRLDLECDLLPVGFSRPGAL